MKALFPLPLLFCLISCASCQLKPDVADAPIDLNQSRQVFQTEDGTTEVGIVGFTKDQTLKLRAYGAGTATIRGVGECGYITSGATEKTGWIDLDTSSLPQKEFCAFNVQNRTNKFDASVIGTFLIRRFFDPNVLPLETTVNGVRRSGVNWVQLRGDPATAQPGTMAVRAGILESRDILLHIGQHVGKLNITGCGFPFNGTDYSNPGDYKLTVDYLYKQAGRIDRDCVFTVTANHNDALKQSASIQVKVYTGGSFLDAPLVTVDRFDTCVNFVDPYVVGVGVNGMWARSKGICVDHAASYKIEGVTSRGRVFYGEHDGKDWKVMK
jgi:hypothetical protein